MTNVRKYQREAAIETIIDSLQKAEAVNMRLVNEQLNLLFRFYSTRRVSGVYTEETMDLWDKFRIIEAKLEVLEIRSHRFEKLKDHLFPTV